MAQSIYEFVERDRLALVHELEVMDSEPEPAFDSIVGVAAELCGVPIALVTILDDERQWFKAKIGLAVTGTPRDQAFCHHAIQEPDEVLEIADAHQDPRFRNNPLVVGDPNIRFYAGVPLRPDQNHAVGTLCVISPEPRRLTTGQRVGLANLGKVVEQLLVMRLAARRERNFRYLSENIGDGLVVLDRELNFRYVSPSVANLLAEMNVDGSAAAEPLVHAEDRSRAIGLLRTLTPEDPTVQIAARVRSPEGFNHSSLFIRATFEEDGSPDEYFVTLRDNTRIHEYQEQLKAQNKSLAAVSGQRVRLVRGLVHDLAAPLAAIRLTAESVSEQLRGGSLAEQAGKLGDYANEAETLVSDLRAVHLPIEEAPQTSRHRTRADLHEVVKMAVAGVATDDAVSIHGGEGVIATLDVRAIQRAVANLVGNALRHTPAGTVIDVRLNNKGADASIGVSDDGPGLPRVVIEQVNGDQGEGLPDSLDGGLGIAIARSLITAHSGTLSMDTSKPTGTHWEISLPGVVELEGQPGTLDESHS